MLLCIVTAYKSVLIYRMAYMRKGIVGPEIKGLHCSKRTVSTSYFKGPGLFHLEKTKKTVLMFWDKKRDVWFEGVHVTKKLAVRLSRCPLRYSPCAYPYMPPAASVPIRSVSKPRFYTISFPLHTLLAIICL